MIADLKPYPEYKESGLPWLGQVPRHWTVRRAKSIFQRIDERSKYGREELLTVSSARGVVPRKTANVTMFKAESYLGYKLCWPGDLVINSLWAWAGGLGVSRHHGIISSAYGVYRIRKDAPMTPAFVHEVVRSSSFSWELRVRSKGVWISRLQLTDISFLDAPMHIPRPDEQAAIVRFLDWVSARLDRAIRAKRKVIALLNEQKQAIVHRVVTRGLDHAVPLRPSGVPWLGDIPRHWEVRALKGVCKIQSGITLGKDYGGQATHEYPYLRVANVQAGHANLTVVKTIRVTKAEAVRCTLQAGDVLMTEGGDPDKLGRGCVWNAQVAPCLHQNHVFAVRPNQSQLEPLFLSALMGTRYARAYFESTAKQTTNLASTNKTKIGQFQVLLPHVDEQRRILMGLNKETDPVNITVSRLEREIDFLREYRTRLVADVVTGKLDVREAAARLPMEAPTDIGEDAADANIDPETGEEEAA
jgi:type I restriction enzyme S subunit